MNDHPVTAPELEELRVAGYFVRRHFVPTAEADELERAADRAVDFHERRPGHMSHVSKPGRMTFVNQLGDDSDAADELRDLAMRPRIAGLAREVAGPRAAHYCYQVVYKHPGHHEPFCWHQDFVHTPSTPGFFNVWVALSDMTVANGCLRVLPGRGLDEVLPYHETPYGHSCWPLDHPDQGVPVEIERGSIFVVTCRTLHMSGPNTTDRPRKAILFAFMEQGAVARGAPVPLTPYRSAVP
jgi:hypothetical protein